MWGDDMKEFTEKHKQVLDYITRSVDAGVPPSVREVCDAMGFRSTSTGHKYIKELEQMGYIAVDAGRNRNIRLLRPDTDRVVQVPLIGTVAAGLPILADQNFECCLPFVAGRHDPRELFALRVKGDSMYPRYLEGDTVILRKQPTCDSGNDCAVLVNGDEATLKQVILRQDGSVELRPVNPAYPPRVYSPAEVERLPVHILGVVVELRRKIL